MKKIALLLMVLVFGFVFISAETAAPAQKPAAQKTLQWSKKPRFYSTWAAANEYCANLDEDGHKDWRVPTIDELRSIVERCPETATGGKCAISDKDGKLRMEDYDKQACRGCRRGRIDKPGNGWFWSASQRPETDHYWVISFKNTRISEAKMNIPYNVYCVR